MVDKIVSGGQTGPDRAGLDVAKMLGITHGGWCPKGRLAEDGKIADEYDLVETDSDDVNERTCKNIDDSDGTIIFVPVWPIPKKDGTILTKSYAEQQNKPVFLVILSSDRDPTENFINWLQEHSISTLNVAGPRESNSRGIYRKTYDLFKIMMESAVGAGNREVLRMGKR